MGPVMPWGLWLPRNTGCWGPRSPSTSGACCCSDPADYLICPPCSCCYLCYASFDAMSPKLQYFPDGRGTLLSVPPLSKACPTVTFLSSTWSPHPWEPSYVCWNEWSHSYPIHTQNELLLCVLKSSQHTGNPGLRYPTIFSRLTVTSLTPRSSNRQAPIAGVVSSKTESCIC